MQNEKTVLEQKPWSTSIPLANKRRFKLLACEIIYREACLLASQSAHIVDVEFLEKGLHDMGKEKMLTRLQDKINAIDTRDYEAILLGYARCNDGVAGLRAPAIPLIIPRAHDCITFFFGSKEAYEKYFFSHPGSYFRTTGWTERGGYHPDDPSSTVMGQLGLDRTYQEYVAKYGEENAQYIFQTLGAWQDNYQRITYIDMGLPLDPEYAELARREAVDRKLSFEQIPGDLRLLRMMLAGDWPEEDFLTVPPKWQVDSENDGRILIAVSQ